MHHALNKCITFFTKILLCNVYKFLPFDRYRFLWILHLSYRMTMDASGHTFSYKHLQNYSLICYKALMFFCFTKKKWQHPCALRYKSPLLTSWTNPCGLFHYLGTVQIRQTQYSCWCKVEKLSIHASHLSLDINQKAVNLILFTWCEIKMVPFSWLLE